MWEARCVPERTDEVVMWVRNTVVPDALAAGAGGTEVFRSDDRVVLITRWPAGTLWTEPSTPSAVERAHAWPFVTAD